MFLPLAINLYIIYIYIYLSIYLSIYLPTYLYIDIDIYIYILNIYLNVLPDRDFSFWLTICKDSIIDSTLWRNFLMASTSSISKFSVIYLQFSVTVSLNSDTPICGCNMNLQFIVFKRFARLLSTKLSSV